MINYQPGKKINKLLTKLQTDDTVYKKIDCYNSLTVKC
jgi:hypothetical protein